MVVGFTNPEAIFNARIEDKRILNVINSEKVIEISTIEYKIRDIKKSKLFKRFTIK